MITSEKEFEEFLLGPLAKHARMVERGVDTQVALEAVIGKKEADNRRDRIYEARCDAPMVKLINN